MEWPSEAGRKRSSGLLTKLAVIVALSLWAVTAAAVHSSTASLRKLMTLREIPMAFPGAPGKVAGLPAAKDKKKEAMPAPLIPASAPPAAPSDTANDSSLVAAPPLFDGMGVRSHDPKALLAYAERLSAAGADVTILRADVSRAVAWDAIGSRGGPAHITPVYDGARVAGARITGFPADSFPILAGLANGDVITSINGYPLSSPSTGDEVYQAARRAGMAVAEVIRGRRRLVLATRWPSDKPDGRRRLGAW
jgi:membrane-associated protease RseP (regulator of RpoE activity)